ncbi:hypothetical protein CWC15_21980, partial [Pseudoalteromonas spongiae]
PVSTDHARNTPLPRGLPSSPENHHKQALWLFGTMKTLILLITQVIIVKLFALRFVTKLRVRFFLF